MRSAALLPFLALGAAVGATPPSDAPAAASRNYEHVEVRLVTIDVTALDSDNRTVRGLGKDSFRLFVDGKETEIDTLDAYCAGEPEPEPRSRRFGDWSTPRDLATGTRRIVLAFDYLHLPIVICPDLGGPCMLHTQALEAYQAALADRPDIQDEEVMVVALTGGLRVEQPFTRDRRTIVETLRRMEYDITLWNGHFAHLTEEGFFRSLESLATLLHATEGPKSVVLLTAGNGPENTYDSDFARIATVASDAQVRFYPVDCRGILSSAGAFT